MRKTKSMIFVLILFFIMSLTFLNPTQGVGASEGEHQNQGVLWKVLVYTPNIFSNTSSASQDSVFWFGLGQAGIEKDVEIYAQPYQVELNIDGHQIKTERLSWFDQYGWFADGIPVHWWLFYHIFEAGYFQPNTVHIASAVFSYYIGYGWYNDGSGNIVFRQLQTDASTFSYMPFIILD